MNLANIKEINGKTIASAELWPNDEGDICLQLNFTDTTSFDLTIPQPQVTFKAHFYKDDQHDGKNITEKLLKRASK